MNGGMPAPPRRAGRQEPIKIICSLNVLVLLVAVCYLSSQLKLASDGFGDRGSRSSSGRKRRQPLRFW